MIRHRGAATRHTTVRGSFFICSAYSSARARPRERCSTMEKTGAEKTGAPDADRGSEDEGMRACVRNTRLDNVVAFTGRKNSGKTTLMRQLVDELSVRGIAVSSVEECTKGDLEVEIRATTSSERPEADTIASAFSSAERCAMLEKIEQRSHPAHASAHAHQHHDRPAAHLGRRYPEHGGDPTPLERRTPLWHPCGRARIACGKDRCGDGGADRGDRHLLDRLRYVPLDRSQP